MHETPEDIRELQWLLDASIARSNPHLTGIVTPNRRLTAQQVATELAGMKVLVVATVTAKGEPRTSCVDGHFLRGKWLFSTSGMAYKARHLKARPALSATYADGERAAVFTHGQAEYMPSDHPEYEALDAYFEDYYGSAASSWGEDIVFLRLHPTWMIGFAMDAATFPSAPEST